MDYSLLVGVHKLTPDEIEEDKLRKKLARKASEKKATKASSKKDKEKEKETKVKHKENLASKDATLSIFDYGGLRSISPDDQSEEIVFMSIIDNLTFYAFGKQLAHFFKKYIAQSEPSTTSSGLAIPIFPSLTSFESNNHLYSVSMNSRESQQ